MNNKNWKTSALGQVCDVKGGKRLPLGSALQLGKTDHPYIRVTDFDGLGGINLSSVRYLKKEDREKIKNYTISSSDLYVSIAGTIGLTGTVPKELNGANLTENACKLVIKNDLDLQYLYYFTLSKAFREEVTKSTRTAAQPKLALTRIKDITISYPVESAEQKRIVRILDEKFVAIEKLKKITDKQLADTKEFFESELNNEFSRLLEGKRLVSMSGIYDVRDGTHDSPKYHKEGRALVTSKNLKDGKLLLDNVKYISESDYVEICKRSGVSVGDVLLAMIGTIGNPVVIKQEPDFAIKNVALFKVPNGQSSEFLRYYLLSNYVKDKMARESRGATQKFVGLGYLRSFLIPQVDYKEQVQIVSKLNDVAEQINQLRKIYQGKVVDLEELKKSYLEQAFAGKL